MWGVVTPEEAAAKIEEQKKAAGITEPKNLEEQAISLVGTDIYEKLIKGYTQKQWGRKCTDLPAFIIKRLPVRLTFDNNYFNALYQGIPVGGYTKMVANMLDGIEVCLDTDYFENKTKLDALADKIVYTGAIDAYFEYQLGALEYRSVRFETEVLDKPNFQGNAAVNYTDRETPWTRIIEHKWFEFGKDDDGKVEHGSAERALFDELGRVPSHYRPGGHVPEDGAAGSHHGSRAYCHPHAHEGLRRHPGPVFHGDGGGDEGVAGV